MKLYKLKLTIAYDGSKFYGSQIQRTQKLPTIVGNFELALKKLQIKPKIEFSGRTDRGVHATGQVCHLDLPLFWNDLKKLKIVAINKIIKPSIIIKHIENCDESFHPRFDAKKRIYRYVISTQEFNPFMNNYITFLKTIDEKEIKKVLLLAKKEKRMTFSYLKDDLAYGSMLALSIGTKVKPILNLRAVKESNIIFPDVLLKISTIYQNRVLN